MHTISEGGIDCGKDPRQNKSGQDKIKQDKIKQDKTRQDKA